MKFRYPGPKPFTLEDELLFYGREEEKDQLTSLILTNKLTVLFGRSGNGKSSLIQAGVIPFFTKREIKYKIFQIRFEPKGKESPVYQLFTELNKHTVGSFLPEISSDDSEVSLWRKFKALQWEAKAQGYGGVLFIMDQFEEVFNFTKQQYDQLGRQLSEIIYNRMPDNFQNELFDQDKDFFDKYQMELEFIKNELPANFLIGIRSDRLYLLDELGEAIKIIFNTRFRLQALSVKHIKNVIHFPALAEGEFASKVYKYKPEAVSKIEQFVKQSADESTEGNIEAFKLQIICQDIESKVIEKQRAAEEEVIVDVELLPDNLNDIIGNYYCQILEGNPEKAEQPFFSKDEKLIVRYLVERKLIDTKTNKRICLDKTTILQTGVTDSILDKLVDSKIIRKELNTVSGQSFELSHDTLIEPVLATANSNRMKDLRTVLSDQYRAKIGEIKKKGIKVKYAEECLMDSEHNLLPVSKTSLKNNPHVQKALEEMHNMGLVNSLVEGSYVLNEAYQDPLINRFNEKAYDKFQRYSKGFFVAAVFSLILFLVTWKALGLYWNEVAMGVSSANQVEKSSSESARIKLLTFKRVFSYLSKSLPRSSIKDVEDKLKQQFDHSMLYAPSVHSSKQRPFISLKQSADGKRLLLFFIRESGPLGFNITAPLSINSSIKSLVVRDNMSNQEHVLAATDACFIEETGEIAVLRNDSLMFFSNDMKLTKSFNLWNIPKYQNIQHILNIESIFYTPSGKLIGNFIKIGTSGSSQTTRSIIILDPITQKVIYKELQDILKLNISSEFNLVNYQHILLGYSQEKNGILIIREDGSHKELSILKDFLLPSKISLAQQEKVPFIIKYEKKNCLLKSYCAKEGKMVNCDSVMIPKSRWSINNGKVIILADSMKPRITIYDSKLHLLDTFENVETTKGVRENVYDYAAGYSSKLLFYNQKDSILTLLTNNPKRRDTIKVPSISSITFSSDGMTIYCVTISDKKNLTVYDLSLKPLFMVYNCDELYLNDFAIARKNNEIYIVDLNKRALNNTDPKDIVRWLNANGEEIVAPISDQWEAKQKEFPFSRGYLEKSVHILSEFFK